MEDQHSHRAEAFGTAEIGALARLYRGEMYQSKVWRNRLDTTANWAIVTTGIALSVTFSNADASPIPILLVSWVVVVFYPRSAPLPVLRPVSGSPPGHGDQFLRPARSGGQGTRIDNHWNDLLAERL